MHPIQKLKYLKTCFYVFSLWIILISATLIVLLDNLQINDDIYDKYKVLSTVQIFQATFFQVIFISLIWFQNRNYILITILISLILNISCAVLLVLDRISDSIEFKQGQIAIIPSHPKQWYQQMSTLQTLIPIQLGISIIQLYILIVLKNQIKVVQQQIDLETCEQQISRDESYSKSSISIPVYIPPQEIILNVQENKKLVRKKSNSIGQIDDIKTKKSTRKQSTWEISNSYNTDKKLLINNNSNSNNTPEIQVTTQEKIQVDLLLQESA